MSLSLYLQAFIGILLCIKYTLFSFVKDTEIM